VKKIQSALISVFSKENLENIVDALHKNEVKLYSTGGTQSFIESRGIPVTPVEALTDYPSILGGRVKTLHPRVFGGILHQRNLPVDEAELKTYQIPPIDLVVVDLYPFKEAVASGASHEEIIEKIDIGGISLIRAAAKNYKDVVVIPSKEHYNTLHEIIIGGARTTLDQRKELAQSAFSISSDYDQAIQSYLGNEESFSLSIAGAKQLRYGENPHQQGTFYGKLDELFEQLHGKALSYNNLLDIDAAVQLMADFKDERPTFAILKHNNACGLATRDTLEAAYKDALAGDPVSAFGGILIGNRILDASTAEAINTLFCEVVIAPGYEDKALKMLQSKKNRILLVQKEIELPKQSVRTALNGVLVQDKDERIDEQSGFNLVTKTPVDPDREKDLVFASIIAKHTKSNTIVLAKNQQLLASGTGQTSRIDALKQAILKAEHFNFDLKGAVMASDAFFPFADSVEIAHKAGIGSVIQPGGSVRDQESIDYCDAHGMAMVFTGTRHFKH
jgi:phosphoribosylaminoimidazolecarboxamide formyltransferase/IMP cyclohydrolase